MTEKILEHLWGKDFAIGGNLVTLGGKFLTLEGKYFTPNYPIELITRTYPWKGT